MILRPRLILQQKTLYSETKTDDPKPRMIVKPKKMILKPRTTGNQGSSKNVICKNVIVPTPCTPPSGDDAMLSVGAGVPKKGAQLQERYCPPHPAPPPPFGDDAMQSVAARILVAE